MARLILCPDCSQPLVFQDGAIDTDHVHPDFLYCTNDECSNTNGYDPWTAVHGKFDVVVKLANLFPKEDE